MRRYTVITVPLRNPELLTEETLMHINPGARVQIDPESAQLAEAATRIAKDRNINFGEALNIVRREQQSTASQPSSAARISSVDPASVVFLFEGERIAKEKNISFCDALPLARQRAIHMASDVVPSDQVRETVQTSLQAEFSRIMGNSAEKIIGSLDLFQVQEAVASALGELGIGSSIVESLKAQLNYVLDELIGDAGQAIVSADDVTSLVTNAADGMQQLYAQTIAALRSTT